jgi:alkylation response protein AidB-like acyl-CoA dehydrogenase
VSMHTRALLAWIAVGLAGLALAAGVTYAATQLSSQRIGLSGEPPSAGEQLAPRRGAAESTREHGQRRHDHRAHRGHRRHGGDPDD